MTRKAIVIAASKRYQVRQAIVFNVQLYFVDSCAVCTISFCDQGFRSKGHHAVFVQIAIECEHKLWGTESPLCFAKSFEEVWAV